MELDLLLSELQNKNKDICAFLSKISKNQISSSLLETLEMKLNAHDKLIVDELKKTNDRITKITTTIVKHIN